MCLANQVVGRDDALFDPFDEMNIAEKIEHVLTDDDFRHDLERHGVKQSKKLQLIKYIYKNKKEEEPTKQQALMAKIFSV